ncbi:MAG: VOC family protein [Acidimicrobiales bacterium]
MTTDTTASSDTTAEDKPAGPRMDHLALASNRAWDHVIRYCHQLGGRWLGGPTDIECDPFYFCQVEFRHGTKLEFIEAYPGPGSDFVRRFLDRNGPGPHHITFKVTDIEATMAAARSAGYEIVNEDVSDPDWKEAFLHPKQSHGIVIQLAQPGDEREWEAPPPLPPTDQGDNTTIDCVTHLVADVEAAATLFHDVLAMEDLGSEDHRLGRRHTLSYGPWTLALVEPSDGPARHWLGNRAGRLLQVEMSVDELGPIAGLRPVAGGHELPPEINFGTRLLLKQNER